MSGAEYVGTELDVFAHARRWKAYFGSIVREALAGTVAEVGAGIGATTEALGRGWEGPWLCLEPDLALARRIGAGVDRDRMPRRALVVASGTAGLRPRSVDTVLYVDVLEHIEDDGGELRQAARALRPGGRLVVLAPAHPALYTPFDAAIGHHRRYTRRSLRAVVPPALVEERLDYLDAAGLLASAANRFVLDDAHPGVRQIVFWDRWLVPLSRRLDPLLGHRVGKSVLGIWRRAA